MGSTQQKKISQIIQAQVNLQMWYACRMISCTKQSRKK